MTNTHRTGISQAVLVVVCLSLSYVSFALVHNIASTRSQGNFDVLVDQSLNLIHQQGDKFDRTLDGLAGLVLASDAVTSTELGEYADALNLHQDKLASTAIGFASLGEVTDQNPVNYVNTHLVESALPAPVDGAGSEHFVIRLAEPRPRHASLLGYDFANEPDLLAAALTARKTGEAIASIGVPKGNRTSASREMFLLRPVYRTLPDTKPDTPEKAFVGFAFLVTNFNRVFVDLASAQKDLVSLRVEYNTHTDHAVLSNSKFVVHKSLQMYGQELNLVWESTPEFEALQPFRARWIVLMLGVLITALISTIFAVFSRRDRMITAIVAQKTRDLETQDKEKRSILENAMLAIVSANAAGEILDTNDAAKKLLRPLDAHQRVKGKLLHQLLPSFNIHSPDGASKLHLNAAGKANSLTIEIEKNTWVTADGDTRITLLLRDITTSERHAQELREAEQRWNLALMGAQIGVFDLNLEHDTSIVSDTWRNTLRIEGHMDARDPYRLQLDRVHPDDLPALQLAEMACIDGETDHAKACFRVNVGQDEWRWIKSDAVVVKRAADGTALRMLGIQLDVTESFDLDQMKHDFVATVSHELRTPLTSIKGALGLLAPQVKGDKPQATDRLIEIATSNCDRLTKLVNDLLDMEKLNAGSMTHDTKPENLTDILMLAAEQLETYASQWEVALEVDIPQGDQYILTDKLRLTQVLTNLLSNACKFAYPGTKVCLTAEAFPTFTKVSVSNLGKGISEEFRGQIFQPFSQADNSDTRQRGGTGLGLNISRHLIEAMGGEIGFESDPGEETVFWFTCPIADWDEIEDAA
ncbi:MAG: ATP-binding protein [Sulfitobacter sp.]|uniref:ATP-binding protein n=1 Tax=Sulfitobacter sp. TaxID=1903071 RepID=UPI004057D49D